MGLSIPRFGRGSVSTYDAPASVPRPSGNPNPHRFKLLRIVRTDNGAVVVKIKYPDCTNYEGNKILVYESGEAFLELEKRGVIDPHFTSDSRSPVARFEPTERGWSMAVEFAMKLHKEG